MAIQMHDICMGIFSILFVLGFVEFLELLSRVMRYFSRD